ncbi:MAG: UDP-glucose/GDP-mannose dehydrogenase family protein [Ruminococcaceae bacterium]|nr:UDP-glucose/GDP-mannose dehydrogenase family protein [Oscillospiraceae bacterium]
MKLTMVGVGYVGLVTAVCLASVGHEVTCLDVDEDRIALLRDGICPLYEPGLEEMMAAHAERLNYTTDHRAAYRDAAAIFVAVGTPDQPDGSANLKYVFTAVKQIAECVQQDCVVVVKSTVPVGTNDRVENLLKRYLKAPVSVAVVSNPEFLSQGSAVRDTMTAARIVIGVQDAHSEAVLREIYGPFNQPILTTDRNSAEMIKYASNDFLALKISYINEIANLCEQVGANVDDVACGMGMDPRIGDKFLRAGIGYGGSCFPKDTLALHFTANQFDKDIKTVKAAIEVNERQKARLLYKSRRYIDDLEDKTVALLGLAFKPDTDDLRSAPSLGNVATLLSSGAVVRAWDPVAQDNFRKVYPYQISYCATIEEAITGADLCLIMTEWDDVKHFDILKYKQLMATPLVLDGRNCYDPGRFVGTGITYDSIGRPAVTE